MSVTVVLVEDPQGSRRADVPAGVGVLTDLGVLAGVGVLGRVQAAGDAVRLVDELCPDVVVVDLGSGSAALAAIGAVVTAAPRVPVLAVSAAADHRADHGAVLAAVRAGATSLLVEPDSGAGWADELSDAVRRTAGGEVVFSPGLADVVLEEFGRPLDPQQGARRLTDREADVLRLIVEGLTARQIATRLVLSPRTVENHVQHMLRKLDLPGRAALVRYAIERGLA